MQNIQKIFISETMRGVKLKLCLHTSDISLYIVFVLVGYVFWSLWQLEVSIDFKWEKWKLFVCLC